MKTIFIKFGFVLLLLLSACYNGHLDAVGMKKSTNTVLNAPDEKILNEGVDERALKLKRANDIFKNIIGNKGCITVEDLASLSADDRFFCLTIWRT